MQISQVTIYVSLTFFSTAATAWLGLYAWGKRRISGGPEFFWMMVTATGYSLFTALIMVAPDPARAAFWENVRWFFIAFIPPTLFIFVLKYTANDQWIKIQYLIFLFLIPIITQVFVWTNFNVWLVEMNEGFETIGPFFLVGGRSFGPWYWVLNIYATILAIGAFVIILNYIQKRSQIFHNQTIVLSIGILVSIIPSVIDTFQIIPLAWLKLTPFGFTITSLIFAWALQHYQFLELIPFVHNKLVDIIPDAIIIIDIFNKIIDINPAAERLTGFKADEVVGKLCLPVLEKWPHLVEYFENPGSNDKNETDTIEDTEGHWYDLRLSPLWGSRNVVKGFVIILHDITARKQAEENLIRQTASLQAVANISTRITTTLDIQKLLQDVVNLTQARFNLYHVHIYLTNETGDTLGLAAGTSEIGRRIFDQNQVVSVSEKKSVAARAARNRQGVLINDVDNEPGILPSPSLSHTQSEIAVPLIAGNQILGVLDVQSDKKNNFTSQDLNILMTLAAQVAAVLQNAQTFSQRLKQLIARDRLLVILYQLSTKIEKHPPIRELMSWLAEQLPAAMQYPDQTKAAIFYEDRIFGTPEARELEKQITQDITISGNQIGKIYISHTHSEPFLQEEQNLLENISQRLQTYIAEQLLQQQQIQLEEATEIARMADFSVDLISNIATLNDRFYKLVGTSLEVEGGYKLPVQTILKRFLHPDDQENALELFTSFLSNPNIIFVDREYRHLRKTETQHMLYRAKIERNDEGKAERMTITIQDITAQVESERAVRESQQLLQKTFTSLQDAVFIIDNKTQQIENCNDAATTIFGYSREEFIGQTPEFLFPNSEMYQKFLNELDSAVEKTGRLFNFEFKMQRKNGEAFNSEHSMSLLENLNGGAMAWVSVVRDITERKNFEKEILTHAEQERLLNDITRAAIEPTDFEKMLQVLADRMGQLFNADGCFIALWDEDLGYPTPVAAYGLFKRRFKDLSNLKPGDLQLPMAVLEENRAIKVDNTGNPQYISSQFAKVFNKNAFLGLPLIANERKLGTVVIAVEKSHQFSPEEVNRGEQAARQIALAILKAQLLEAEREQRRNAETLQEAGMALSASLDRKTIFDNILEKLANIVPYRAASIMDVKDERVRILHWIGDESLSHEYIDMLPNLDQAVGFTPTLRRVYENRSPVVIADTIEEPDWLQLDASKHIRSWIGVPIVFEDEVIAIITLDHDQPDFYKQADGERLVAFAIQAALALENARLFEQMEEVAITDGLTGLFNRRHFFNLASNEFQRAYRYKQNLSAIMLDIDHFKQINDTYGHLVGDQVLQGVAETILSVLRKVDISARYGGEEFVILLPETDIAGAEITAERLRQRIENSSISTENGLTISITVSLGVSCLDKEKNPDGFDPTNEMEKLVDQADQALYVSKQGGRNTVSVYNKKKE